MQVPGPRKQQRDQASPEERAFLSRPVYNIFSLLQFLFLQFSSLFFFSNIPSHGASPRVRGKQAPFLFSSPLTGFKTTPNFNPHPSFPLHHPRACPVGVYVLIKQFFPKTPLHNQPISLILLTSLRKSFRLLLPLLQPVIHTQLFSLFQLPV